MATNSKEKKLSIDEGLGNAIIKQRNELEHLWFSHLRKAWGPVAESRLSILQQPNQTSLLDVALKTLSGREEVVRQDVESFIQRVRRRTYSITDVFNEFTCLEDTFREFLPAVGIKAPELTPIFERFKKSFCSLFGAVLRETSEFYEHVIERGNTGFCQTDKDGRIVYANQEIIRIYGSNDLIGKTLTSFFDGYQRDLVQKVMNEQDTAPMIHSLSFRSSSGKFVPVGAELARVFIGGKPVGGYAHLTDISKPVKLQNDLFDRLQVGIIRANAERKITYMNKSLCEMLDIPSDDWMNRPIDWLVPDDDNKRIINHQVHQRFEGKSDKYEVRLRRGDGKSSVPVKITAAPEKTTEGKIIRTIGVVRSMVRERMHQHIEREREPQKLLQTVMEEIMSAIPFHRVNVALFSRDEKHVRSFFHYSINGTPIMQRRWWEMTPAMQEWVKEKKIVPVPNIEVFYSQPQFAHLKSDPAIKEIRENFSSFIYCPVFREGKVVACTVFYSKDLDRYQEKDQRILQNLPLASAVLMAIHDEEKKNLEFLLNLSKEISRAGDNVQKIARVLVDSVASHYDWENVSLFNTRRAQGHFHLLSQHTSEAFRIPEDFTQPIDEGILGLVYKTKQPANIDNVKEEPYRTIFKPTMAKTRSELCIPIESGELFWLLNIEDPLENAFSKDEELALVQLIEDVRVLLERSWLRKFLENSLLSTSDAVWVTDNQGKINRTNPAARRLLKFSKEGFEGRDLADILRDRGMAKRLIAVEKEPNVKIGLRTKEGKFVNVLLSKFRLQEYFKPMCTSLKIFPLRNASKSWNISGKCTTKSPARHKRRSRLFLAGLSVSVDKQTMIM
jgi:PAS domain S-box-containing protein